MFFHFIWQKYETIFPMRSFFALTPIFSFFLYSHLVPLSAVVLAPLHNFSPFIPLVPPSNLLLLVLLHVLLLYFARILFLVIFLFFRLVLAFRILFRSVEWLLTLRKLSQLLLVVLHHFIEWDAPRVVVSTVVERASVVCRRRSRRGKPSGRLQRLASGRMRRLYRVRKVLGDELSPFVWSVDSYNTFSLSRVVLSAHLLVRELSLSLFEQRGRW